ncbi:MAG: hypothetical protein IIA83_12100 [Thaumarchaeota archaeon]|nr:hypothetical protein [Nitrososphaerota archaeon]
MKQIQDFARTYGITSRHTIRLVQYLEELGWVTKAKIQGKRKRKGYQINEDNIGTLSEMWFPFYKNKTNEKPNWKSLTQKGLSQFIDNWRRSYHDSLVIRPNDSKKLKKIKEEQKEIFNWLQILDMYHCVLLIANIEWALRTGSLGSGKGKTNVAERNIRKLEEFIEELSDDLKQHDKRIWKHILGSKLGFSQYNIIFGNEPMLDRIKLSTASLKAQLQH